MPARLAQHFGGQKVHHADEFGHAARIGAAIEHLGFGQLRDLALEHHRDAVRHHQRFFLVMRHQHEGNADLPLQLDQLDLHLLAHLLVERAQRFIEQQHLGLQDQRARQRHPLPLAARKRMGGAAPIALQADHLQRFLDPARLFGGRAGSRGAARSRRSVPPSDAERSRSSGTPCWSGAGWRARAPCACPSIITAPDEMLLEARDGAQKRGLAAARRPQQREELARLDGRGDAAQRVIIAIILMHILKLDHRRAVGHRKPPVSVPPVRAMPRRRKYSAMVSKMIDAAHQAGAERHDHRDLFRKAQLREDVGGQRRFIAGQKEGDDEFVKRDREAHQQRRDDAGHHQRQGDQPEGRDRVSPRS